MSLIGDHPYGETQPLINGTTTDEEAPCAIPHCHNTCDDDEYCDDDDENLPPSRSMSVVPMAMLGSDFVGPISEQDKKLFERNQKLRYRTINALLGGKQPIPSHLRRQRTIARTKTIINEEGKLMEVKEQVVEPITESWEGDKALTDRQIRISSYVAYLLFLICGIGYQIQFSAVTSAIVYFKDLYGPSIFRIIVGAFNAPLLPILLLQLKFDQRIDVRFGSLQTFRLRIFITMMVCSGILYVLPWLDKSLAVFICLVALLGIFNGIGTGAYFALVSVFPIKTPIFWSVGQRLSTGMILAVQFSVMPPSLSKDQENAYYFLSCATVSLIGVVSFLVLIHMRLTRYQLYARDCQVREELQLQKSGEKVKVSKWELIKVVWPTSLSGALIYFGDVAVVTSLTYMPSSDGNNNLSLILLYITYFSDFAGRQLVLIPKRVIWNQTSELVASIIRFLFIPVCFVYIKTDIWRNDWFLYVFIAVFGVLGGYTRTLVFTIGPQAVSLDKRTEVSIILNLGIALGVYAGIGFSFIAGATFLT